MARDIINALTLMEEIFGTCSVCAEHDEIFIHPSNAPYDCYEDDDWPLYMDILPTDFDDDEKYPPQLTPEQAKQLNEYGCTYSLDAEGFRMFV